MDVEKEVLKAIIFDAEQCSAAFETLIPDHFVEPVSRTIFKAALELHNAGSGVDLVTLSEKCKNEENVLMSLASGAVSAANLKSHCEIVINNYYKEKSKEMAAKIFQNYKDLSPGDIREGLEEISFFLSDRTQDKGLVGMNQITSQTLTQIDEIRNGGTYGISTGFREMDAQGLYLPPKTITVLAARPGMGKSALALDIAQQSGVVTALFNLEMTNEQQCKRMISMETSLSRNELHSKKELEKFNHSIIKAAQNISQKKLYMNDNPSITVGAMMNQCKRLKASKDLELVVVDYVGLMSGTGKFENRVREMGWISKAMKRMAKELDVSILELSQLNRKCEERGDKRPILADLRESGDLEQDAELVLMIYRDEVYNPGKSVEGKTEVLVRKNREGPTGYVDLMFDKASTHFKDYEVPQDEYLKGWNNVR